MYFFVIKNVFVIIVNETFHSFRYKIFIFKVTKENNIVPVDLHEILDANTPKLTDTEAHSIEGNLTTEEALSTLKDMQNI